MQIFQHDVECFPPYTINVIPMICGILGAKFYAGYPFEATPVKQKKTGDSSVFDESSLQGSNSNDCLFDSIVTV